jgi:hypothetical protein
MAIFPQIPEEFRGQQFLAFAVGTDPSAAAVRFRERFGCEPRVAITARNNLLVGPVAGDPARGGAEGPLRGGGGAV